MVMVRAVQTNPAPDGKDRLGTTQTKTDSIWVASGLQRVSGIKNWGVQVELAVLGFETRRKLNWPNPNLPETTIPLTLVLPLSLSLRSVEIRQDLNQILWDPSNSHWYTATSPLPLLCWFCLKLTVVTRAKTESTHAWCH